VLQASKRHGRENVARERAVVGASTAGGGGGGAVGWGRGGGREVRDG
jgi:hypothetical protein